MTRNYWLVLAAVVVFVVGAVLVLTDDSDPELISVLLFAGLATFAAAHLPSR